MVNPGGLLGLAIMTGAVMNTGKTESICCFQGSGYPEIHPEGRPGASYFAGACAPPEKPRERGEIHPQLSGQVYHT